MANVPIGKLYSVATGVVNPFMKESREAAKFIGNQDGFVAVHPAERGCLWMFDSLNAAKIARNNMIAEGIQVGNNICSFNVGADGVPEFEGGC